MLKDANSIFLNMWKVFSFLYLFFLVTTISNAATNISLGAVILVTIWMYYNNKYRVKLPEKSFLYPYILFFFSLLIATISINDQKSIHDLWKYFTWSHPFFVFYWISLPTSFETVYRKCTLAIMLVFSLVSFYFLLTNPVGTRITGFSNHANLYAILIESVLPYSIAVFIAYRREYKRLSIRKNKYYFMGAGILSLTGFIALLLTQSRGACAGFILGGICLLILKKFFYTSPILKKGIILTLGIVAIGGIIVVNCGILSRSYDNERILLWTSSYHMWQDHKLVGVGFSNWKEEYVHTYILSEAKEPNLSMPHNVIVSFFSRTGTIGGAGYLVFLIGEMIFLVKKIKRYSQNISYQAMFWAFMSISIHGIVDTGITNKFAMQIFFAYAGIVLALNEKKSIKTK